MTKKSCRLADWLEEPPLFRGQISQMGTPTSALSRHRYPAPLLYKFLADEEQPDFKMEELT